MNPLLALCLCSFVFALPPTTLAAHDGEVHKNLMGTVQTVSDTAILVKGSDGMIVSVALKANTKYVRGTSPVKRDVVKVGERVGVGVSSEKEPFTAVVVRLGEAKTTGKR
jgi:hypothetical protein